MRLMQRRRLDVARATWSIDCIMHVRSGNQLSSDIWFTISSVDLGHTFQAAIERARSWSAQAATIDGAAVRALWLDKAELSYDSDGGERIGDLTFRAMLALPFTVPFDLGDTELMAGLRAADALLGCPIRADAITITERYYIVRIFSIGTLGAFVDRRTGVAHIMSSELAEELWIARYERKL